MKLSLYDWCISHKKESLLKEWDYSKNNDTPRDVSYASNKRANWKCKEGHQWEAMIANRSIRARGCPYCSHNKPIIGETDLGTLYPSLSLEWNYKRNNGLLPSDVLPFSNKKVWWICAEGHEWQSTACNRTIAGRGCPYCSNQEVLAGYNDFESLCPEIAKEWDYSKNQLKPSDYGKNSTRKVWWICPTGHSYEASIHNRVNGKTSCPYCANQKLLKGFNDFQTTNPDLIADWDYEKNELKPDEVFASSHMKVWWVCKNKHHYQASLADHTKGNGCPICNKRKKSSFPEQAIYYYVKSVFPDAINGYKDENVLGKRMELDIFIPSVNFGIEYDGRIFHSKQSHEKDNRKYELCHNHNIKLIRISEDEPSTVSRLCDYRITIQPANSGWLNYAITNTCAYLGKTVFPDVDRDRKEILSLLEKRNTNLAEIFPEIAAEWNYQRNYPLVPENVAPYSSEKVWWKCSKGHEWQTRIGDRTSKGNACPACAKLKLPKYSKTNLASYRPDVANLWDYEKNGELEPSMVGGNSNIHAWFKCPICENSWNERIYNVVKRQYLCPKCKDKQC